MVEVQVVNYITDNIKEMEFPLTKIYLVLYNRNSPPLPPAGKGLLEAVFDNGFKPE